MLDTLGLVHIFVRGCDRALWRLSEQPKPVPLYPTYRPPTPQPNLPPLDRGQPAAAAAAAAAAQLAAARAAAAAVERKDARRAAAGAAAGAAAMLQAAEGEGGEGEWAGGSFGADAWGDESADVSWGEWVSMGGIITSAPAPAVDAEGMLHIFCRGITRALTHVRQRWNGTAVAWEPWESLGGALASGPQQSSIIDGSDFLNLYVRGGDKAVWRKYEQANVTTGPSGRRLGVRWSNWESLGGVMSSGVAVGKTPDGLSEVFARGPDRGLWHKRQAYRAGSAEPGWGKWAPLSGTLSSAPEVVQPTYQGELHVVARGLDGGVWHKAQVGGAQPNGTVQWTQWRSLGGATRLFSC